MANWTGSVLWVKQSLEVEAKEMRMTEVGIVLMRQGLRQAGDVNFAYHPPVFAVSAGGREIKVRRVLII